jgi:hypothetical protein
MSLRCYAAAPHTSRKPSDIGIRLLALGSLTLVSGRYVARGREESTAK